MFGWFKRWLSARPVSPAPAPPVTPPPGSPRLKSYQAETGYVYQYSFEGRHCRDRETAFLFSVTAQRTAPQRVSIVLPEAALAPFEQESGRRLAENERYGVAKMALFGLFDASEKPEQVWKGTRVEQAHAREYLQVLDL
jgi:hypothetical protein